MSQAQWANGNRPTDTFPAHSHDHNSTYSKSQSRVTTSEERPTQDVQHGKAEEHVEFAQQEEVRDDTDQTVMSDTDYDDSSKDLRETARSDSGSAPPPVPPVPSSVTNSPRV